MQYSKSILGRRFLVLVKNAVGGNSVIGLFAILSFIFRYLIRLIGSKSKQQVRINLKSGRSVFLRTRSSDIEVFLQHYIYKELYGIEARITKPVDYIVDAGANIGLTTIILSELFPKATILSIEMELENYNCFQLNCADFIKQGRVISIHGAFYHEQKDNLNINTSKIGEWAYFVSEENEASGNVKCITLNDVVRRFNGHHPDIIKMDIEGSEIGFLMNETVSMEMFNKSTVLLELHGFKAYLEYFSRLRHLQIADGYCKGEFWITSPKNE